MKKVVIIGAGGHGRVVADIVRSVGDEVVGFLDDDLSLNPMGLVKDYVNYPDCCFTVAIGNAAIREKIVDSMDVEWYTAIHSTAVVSDYATIGEGTVIMANSVINNGAQIGKHCIINTSAVVEHDNIIKDYAHISVGVRLGGTVTVGRSTWLGIGSTVINNISICDNCMVGAGAVVIKDISESGIYKGVPAK